MITTPITCSATSGKGKTQFSFLNWGNKQSWRGYFVGGTIGGVRPGRKRSSVFTLNYRIPVFVSALNWRKCAVGNCWLYCRLSWCCSAKLFVHHKSWKLVTFPPDTLVNSLKIAPLTQFYSFFESILFIDDIICAKFQIIF